MAETVLAAETRDQAFAAFIHLAQTGETDIDLQLGDWPAIHIYLPETRKDSAITPPFMEAFLQIQKQIFQLAALAKSGVADTKQLSETEIHDLSLAVVVTAGSSNLKADLADQIKKLLPKIVDKMTGKQLTIVVLGFAILVGGDWGWKAWLEHERVTRIEELKSQEHLEALSALRFANEEQTRTLLEVLQILREQGPLGQRASDAAIASFEALLRAASRTTVSTINGQELTYLEATSLRTSPKRRTTIQIVRQEMRVIDINTEDPLNIQFILLDESTGDQHRLKLHDSLFARQERQSLFTALETREAIWVELALRGWGDEVRSVDFIRVAPPPDLPAERVIGQ